MKTTRRRDGLAGQAFNNSAVTNLLIRIVVSLVCVSSSRGAINALQKPLMSRGQWTRLKIREKPTVALHNNTNGNIETTSLLRERQRWAAALRQKGQTRLQNHGL